MSRYLGTGDVDAIQILLSAERLATFQGLTSSGLPEDGIELHQATMSLGVSIMAVTGLVEVSLRNAICHAMNNNFCGNHWLRKPPPNRLKWAHREASSIAKATQQAQRAAYSKMTGVQKSALDSQAYPRGVPPNEKHRTIAKQRQATITVPDSQVIAQLTIHFWKRMFSENYEQTLWKPALKTVFPNKTLNRSDVADHLEVIYEMRNRLAHHEPVYGTRLDSILKSIDFVSLNLFSRKPSLENSFAKLIMPQRDLLHGQVAIFKATFERLTSCEMTSKH